VKLPVRTPETVLEQATRNSRLSLTALKSAIPTTAVVLAALIAVLILIPSSVWHQPATDAVYRGFDPNLMYISPTGPAPEPGVVTVSNNELSIVAKSNSHPTVHLLTTPLSFSAVLDAVVVTAPAQSVPLQIELWSAESSAGYSLVFDPKGNVIRAVTITNGNALQDLVGGTISSVDVGPFQVGQPYRIALDVDEANKRISSHVAGPGLLQVDSTVTPAEAPQLFKAFRYALTVSSSAQSGSSGALVRNFTVTIPHQPLATAEETVKVDDVRARILVLASLFAAVLLCLVVGLPRAWRWRSQLTTTAAWLVRAWKVRASILLPLVLILVLYLLANSALFALGSLHYDVFSSKVWSYVAFKTGLPDLYYRTGLVSVAAAWSGVPLHEAGFPYGITKAYYYLTVGWAYHLWPGASSVPVNDFAFESLLKSLNVIFAFVDGILVYTILKRLVSRPTALTSALLFALNPAVVLVMSIWGSTETISVFFILGSILLAERNQPLGAWLMLAGAAFTRPQMLVLAFLLGAVYLRKFGVGRNLAALSWTLILAFIVMAPFALAISPSVPIDWIARTLIFHFGQGQADLPYLGTSPGYYSIWTIPLLVINGQHGLARMWSPSTQDLLGSATYGQVGAALSVLFVISVGALLLFNKRLSDKPGQYLPLVAFGMLGWLMLTPGLISRYFVYGIVGIILCRKVFTASGYVFALVVLTAITVVTAYGHLGLDFLGYSGNVSVLSPTNNSFSNFVFSVFSSDFFITLGTAANVGVLVVIGMKAWDSIRGDTPPELQRAAAATAI
jgi:hypothetical protein